MLDPYKISAIDIRREDGSPICPTEVYPTQAKIIRDSALNGKYDLDFDMSGQFHNIGPLQIDHPRYEGCITDYDDAVHGFPIGDCSVSVDADDLRRFISIIPSKTRRDIRRRLHTEEYPCAYLKSDGSGHYLGFPGKVMLRLDGTEGDKAYTTILPAPLLQIIPYVKDEVEIHYAQDSGVFVGWTYRGYVMRFAIAPYRLDDARIRAILESEVYRPRRYL